MKLLVLVAEPSPVVTITGPVVAPAGTTAVRWPEVTPVGGGACTPLKLTVTVPTLRLVPLIVTLVPTGPNKGEKPNIVGCTRKLLDEKQE